MLFALVNTVVGCALVVGSSRPLLAQSSGAAEPRVRVMSGAARISGRLIAVDADTLTIVSDAERDNIVKVPLSRITRAAISDGKRPWPVAVLAGVGAGVGAGYFGFLVAVSGCAEAFVFGCSSSGIRTSRAVGVATGSVVGVTMTYHLVRERWRAVPVQTLRELSLPGNRSQ
jgi:hypothetical protein